ncbi:MAG: hypothetical protein ACOXZ4_07645 [Sphaerochaetaceae bacterium]
MMSARVFLKNLPRDIGGMNTVYEKQFISGREPVRTNHWRCCLSTRCVD